MSRSTDSNPDGKYHQLVLEARWQMQQARNQFWEEIATRGCVSDETRQNLATRALQYYDVMWEFKDEKQEIAQAWEQSNVEQIKELGSQSVPVPDEAPGDTKATETTLRPALTKVDPQKIIQLTKELDDIAMNLGFSASVDSGRPLGKVGGPADELE